MQAVRPEGRHPDIRTASVWMPDFAPVDGGRRELRSAGPGHRGAARRRVRAPRRARAPAARRARGQADPHADRAAVVGRVPPPARVPVGDTRQRSGRPSARRRISPGLQYEPRPGTRVQAHGVLHRPVAPDHDPTPTARSATTAGARRSAPSCSRPIAAGRGSRGSDTRSRTRRESITRAIRRGCSRTTSHTASTPRRAGSAGTGSSAAGSSCTRGSPYTPVSRLGASTAIATSTSRSTRRRTRPARRSTTSSISASTTRGTGGPRRCYRVPRRPERLHERERRDLLLQLRLLAAGRVQVAADHPVDRASGGAVRALALVRARRCAGRPGCTDDVDPPWQLDHDRIVAVRATPPRIASGETARLDVLRRAQGRADHRAPPDTVAVVSPISRWRERARPARTVTAPRRGPARRRTHRARARRRRAGAAPPRPRWPAGCRDQDRVAGRARRQPRAGRRHGRWVSQPAPISSCRRTSTSRCSSTRTTRPTSSTG